MPSEAIRQRSDLLGTLVVTRDTGRKLGVVSQLWVDVDQREVVAVSLRPNLLYGTPQPMLLSSIRQVGDVILVDSDDAIEDIDVEIYNSLINCEVITETGELLGKVRGYRFDVDNGQVTSLIIASFGIPLIPDQVVSTYELSIDEIVSSGPDRLIVIEGAEERLMQLSVGVLERLGIGRAPWERDEEEEYAPRIRSDNQLGTGMRTPMSTRRVEPAVQEAWDEDNWEENRQVRRQPQRQVEPYYEDEDEEEDNWSDATNQDKYEKYPAPVQPVAPENQYDDEDADDLEEDVWEEEPKAYQAPRLNIPEKAKAPEYEEGY
jgi:sporulation protein YlmC with PRC-barrel domain